MYRSSILVFAFIAFSSLSMATAAADEELEKALAEEIKEYHFHVYFFQDNPTSNASALSLFNKINRLVQKGFFHTVPLRVNRRPVGPHSIGSYEVWCPKEHFSRAYSFMLLNRGMHQVLIHPLTKEEVRDHSERAAFMGNNVVPLDLTPLSPMLSRVPLQYPELHLGYSAPSAQRRAQN